MPKNYSVPKHALAITADNRILSQIKSATDKFGISIHTEYDSLHSVKVIKKVIAETRNTAFINKAFNRLVNEWGLPSFILIDYRIDLGLDSAPDADQRHLLKTFLTSYLIMSRKPELSSMEANFILLAGPNDIAEARVFENDPLKILDILETQNESINKVIRTIKLHPTEMKRIFELRTVPVEGMPEYLEKALNQMIKKMEQKKEESPTKAQETGMFEPDKKAKQPHAVPQSVQVAFLVNDKLAYVNNRPVETGGIGSLKDLAPREFYVMGRCDHKTQHEVARMIRHAVKNGYDDFTFSMEGELVVNLSRDCTIDSTAISLLVGLFTKDLALFKKKIIKVNSKNANILEKSAGYIVIKKYIRHV